MQENRLAWIFGSSRSGSTWLLRMLSDLEGVVLVEAHRFERQPSAARGRRRFIRQARPGGWRDSLSPSEQRAMHEAMGDALAEFGYEVHEPLAATG